MTEGFKQEKVAHRKEREAVQLDGAFLKMEQGLWRVLVGWYPCRRFLAPNSSFVSVPQTAPQKAQLNKAASISIPLLTKLQIKRGKRGGLGTSPLCDTWKCGRPAHTGENQCFGLRDRLVGSIGEDHALATRNNHVGGHQVSVRE